MKLTDKRRYGHNAIGWAPDATRFNPELKAGEDPEAVKRYRLVVVVGMDATNPLALDVNMLLTHQEASIIYRCMCGEDVLEDGGNWPRRSMDIAMELGRACTFDEGLKNRLARIVREYCFNTENNLNEDERHVLRYDERRIFDDVTPVELESTMALMLIMSGSITYYANSLEVCDEPVDDYDFFIDYEDDGREKYMEAYSNLLDLVHPELAENAEPRTITINDVTGRVYEHIQVDPLSAARADNLYLATRERVASILAEECVNDEEYGRQMEEYIRKENEDVAKMRKAPMKSQVLQELEDAMQQPIDRDEMDDEELLDEYYFRLSGTVTLWTVTDEQTGKTYCVAGEVEE